MAAVVRVKRRIDEVPVDSLVFSSKRLKVDDSILKENPTEAVELKSTFRFAGTVSSKTEAVTPLVHNAIRRKKLQQEYKLHSGADVTDSTRLAKRVVSSHNRLKVVSSNRDLTTSPTNTQESTSHQQTEPTDNSEGPSTNQAATADVTDVPADVEKTVSENICLYDVEQDVVEGQAEKSKNPENGSPTPPDTVTCNGVAMLREKAAPAQYVYDLYYTSDTHEFDYRALENALAIEAFQTDESDGLVADPGSLAEMYGEDDDSNDEMNWRNDYPDEDPRVYTEVYDENGGGFWAAEDEREAYQEDYGMSKMMSQRLNLDDEDAVDLSSEDEDYYKDKPVEGVGVWRAKQDYSSFRRDMQQEVKNDDEDDDS